VTDYLSAMMNFDNSYARDLEGMYLPFAGPAWPDPRLVVLNAPLARDLGLDPDALAGPEGVAMLSGHALPAGAQGLAMAYAGHQFGGFSPQLGDGRALLVGEFLDPEGARHDLHLKGSGRTAFSRGGDGKAVLGPMLREYIVSEAIAAHGIPTTRALAVCTTGETIWRETPGPGAVLARTASSHLRVGTFEFFAARRDLVALRRLADYAIARHDPDLAGDYAGFLARVVARQMKLVAQWMGLGFVHGVMNTDNMTISGETIDYGPCAFLDDYQPGAVFSSIDRHGRYAYDQQGLVAQWNLARLGETLVPLMLADGQTDALERVQQIIGDAAGQFETQWAQVFAAKLGLAGTQPGDAALARDFLTAIQGRDFTASFRALAEGPDDPALRDWLPRWRARTGDDPDLPARLRAVNPAIIARNHLVEAALAAATEGDLFPMHRLVAALRRPFDDPGDWAGPPTVKQSYVTYCGT
jgi:uncharacterized protein YdiU (UPF0061 family)